MNLVEAQQDKKVILATPAPISHRTAEENLGLGYLAAMLRKNAYSVEIVDGWLEGLTPDQIAKRILDSTTPLYVGFSAYRSNMEKAMETVKILRNKGFCRPVVAGGFGPSFHPSEFLKAGFDVVIRGEAEQAAIDLAAHYWSCRPTLNEISGASFIEDGREIHVSLQPLRVSIDELPHPSRDTLPFAIQRKSPIQILSARGCEAHCLFCSVVSFQRLARGPQWRQRSIPNFVDELDTLYQQGVTHFKVLDDSFIEPPRDEDWCRNLADEITARGLQISLRGQIRANRVNDCIIRELKRAGFISFACGIENFAQSALTRMNKTATKEQNLATLELFARYGIVMQQGMILFDPNTTMAELEENYYGLRKYDYTVIKGVFTEMFAAEGTPLTKQLRKKGMLKDDISGLGNHKYVVSDQRARLVYSALKTWHKSHSYFFDMTIDPVSAPKSLTRSEFDIFMPLVKEIRHKDLGFMHQVMDFVYDGISADELKRFAKDEIESEKPWYQQFQSRVEAAYKGVGLLYDACENPFLS